MPERPSGIISTSRRLGVMAALIAFAVAGCIVPQPGGGGGGGAPGPQIVPAQFSKMESCSARVGGNGGRGFWDPTQGCWSCPSGSARTIFAVNGSDACQVGGVFGNMISAEYLGGSTCEPYEMRVGNECYICPQGRGEVRNGQPVCVL